MVHQKFEIIVWSTENTFYKKNFKIRDLGAISPHSGGGISATSRFQISSWTTESTYAEVQLAGVPIVQG